MMALVVGTVLIYGAVMPVLAQSLLGEKERGCARVKDMEEARKRTGPTGKKDEMARKDTVILLDEFRA